MMKENYPDQNKTAKDNKKIMVESVEVRQVGEYRTSINHIPDVTESQPPKANPVPNSTMNNKSSPF